MLHWVEIAVAATVPTGGLIIYFIRLESRLAKIMNDVCWIKKVLNSRGPGREKKEK